MFIKQTTRILTIQQRQTRVKYYFQLPWHQKISSLKIMMLIILSEKRGAKNSNKKKKMDFLQLFLCQNFFNPLDLIFFQVQDLISRAWCGSGQLDWSDELSESEKLKMLTFWAENISPWKLFECFAFDWGANCWKKYFGTSIIHVHALGSICNWYICDPEQTSRLGPYLRVY